VYEGRQFTFAVDDITLPNGVQTEIALVRHPGSTAIVPIDHRGRVILTRQYRHPVAAYTLEVPAGTMDPGESPLACARRELEEETGFKAGELTEITRVHILPSYSDEVIVVYLARDLTPTRQNPDPDEIIEVETYPMNDAMQLIEEGNITDALTILALQKVRPLI
jgi:ADP-ribose pyrophosphatase